MGSYNIIFSIGQGILWTFVGLYTQSRIRKLRNEVCDIRKDHERIVEAVAENKASIKNLEACYKELNSTIAIFKKLESRRSYD